MSSHLSAIYTRELPPFADIEATYNLPQLQAFVKQIEGEVGLLAEESRIFSEFLASHRDKDAAAAAAVKGIDDDDDDGTHVATATATAAAAAQQAGGGAARGANRRGRAYRKRSSEQKQLYLTAEEKMNIATADADRLKTEKDRVERLIDEAKEVLDATVEEAHSRVKETKMEMAYFKREVGDEREISAEKLMKYIADKPMNQQKYVQKTQEKCTALAQQINKLQSQMKMREDVGNDFQAIDFEQLKIENHQFTERIEQKNQELVDLKGTTTRTVQSLNNLTDRLGRLITEQAQLRKELKLRQDHVEKLTKEIDSVKKEGLESKNKNTALKIQHESVKVPKVEDYIAQKAEAYELAKAAHNWQRKVEIASGHVAVMKQQILSLRKKLTVVAAGSGSASSRR